MSGCTRYNYLLLTSFKYSFSVLLFCLRIVLTFWLFPLKCKRSKTKFTLWWIMHSDLIIYQDLASIPLGQSRVTSWPSTTRLCYQVHCLLVTTLLSPLFIKSYGRWWKLMLMTQGSGKAASSQPSPLPLYSWLLFQWLSIEHASCSTTTRFGKSLVCK